MTLKERGLQTDWVPGTRIRKCSETAGRRESSAAVRRGCWEVDGSVPWIPEKTCGVGHENTSWKWGWFGDQLSLGLYVPDGGK